ncbi:MAG: hypothetical protein JWN70_541 [Planctomycetaceae bacterium]|nr:hypothetical protein [Planctomycetaceae bacterium]
MRSKFYLWVWLIGAISLVYTVAFMALLIGSHLNWTAVVYLGACLAWTTMPYLILGSWAYTSRNNPAASYVLLTTTFLISVAGYYLYWQVFGGQPPGKFAGLAFVFFPFYQLGPTIVGVVIALAVARWGNAGYTKIVQK